MSTDFSRTPVLVGVGQITARLSGDQTTNPLTLMVAALEAAEADAGVSLIAELDELVAVSSFVWHPPNPALLVAEHLGIANVRTRLTSTGGNLPQQLIHESARRISAGELDAIGVVGAEAMHSAQRLRRGTGSLNWPDQSDDVAPSEMVGEDRIPLTPEEYRHGLTLPVDVYPLFENARRARNTWSIREHRERLGQLWARFADVARDNPRAWIRSAPSPEDIVTPTPSNRMVGFPYTKYLVANMPVDQGAAYVMMSLERARRLGVDESRLVFPQAGVDANDHWFVSERPELDRSPAMTAIWSALNQIAEVTNLASMDLYSCFPTVVETACEVMGIDPLTSSLAPTLTGGLTFFGGPGNNYVTHSIAETVSQLRGREGTGLVTGLGMFSTKHSWGTYATSPPPGGFASRDLSDDVARLVRQVCVETNGEVTVETYAVTHGRDRPARLIVAGKRADGARVWAHSTDPELTERAETQEIIGSTVVIDAGSILP